MISYLPPCPPTFRREDLYIAPTGPKPLKRVLIANRGEIALRIIRTCQQQGVETIAIYSDVDSDAPYVLSATLSVFIGSMEGDINPYMNGDLLIKTAITHQADAIHPGYGYLSENADFADAVQATSRLIFLGPQGETMRQIGEKSRSKQLLRKAFGAKAPLVPGYDGSDQSDEVLQAEAINIGFPLMIKASFGGGGRGMRIVRDVSNLGSEISRARSEAQRYFGSPTLLMEKYIEEGKHIEVQIFGDDHGNVYALGERECSVQRRHQKIIEESPSACLTSKVRKNLFKSAIEIGALLSYRGAGTIEYIVKEDMFSFLEVNTRLQVEHPVTEMCTGLDLVSLQIYVGGNGDLSLLPNVADNQVWGHSIECRLCAEEPGADFAPRTGTIRTMAVPTLAQPGVRFDTGISTGSTVSIHFDAMLGKLIVHSSTRELAIQKMQQVLQSSVFIGIPTNTTFMSSCLAHSTFMDGTYNTSFVPKNLDWLLQRPVNLSRSAFCSVVNSPNIPIGAIAPAFHLFQHLRTQLHPARAGLNRGFRLSQQTDLSIFSQKENYVVSLPDGGKEWEVMVEYKGAGAGADSTATFDLSLWMNLSEFAGEAAAEEVTKRYGSKLKPKALEAQKNNARKTAGYYGALPNRDGLEGRKLGEWNLGVKEEDVTRIRSTLISSDVSVASLPISATRKPEGNNRWINASMKVELNGSMALYVMSTDHSFEEHETGPQVAWLWSPTLAGPIKVVRKCLRVYADEVQVADEDEAAKGAFVTPMPAKVLQLMVKEGEKVEAGQALLICESMKIETTVKASKSGFVSLSARAGDTVPQGRVLCSISDQEIVKESSDAAGNPEKAI